MKVIENALADPGAIVQMATEYEYLFMDYPEATPKRLFDPYRENFETRDDRMHVLRMGYNMPDDLAALVADQLGMTTRDRSNDIRIYRYDEGDYMQPRRSDEATGIYMLTSSQVDGVTVSDADGGFIKFRDTAGMQIIAEPHTWRWVDPVRDPARFTLITDPPVRGRPPVRRPDRRRGGTDRRASSDRRAGVSVQVPPPTTDILGEGSNSVVYATLDETRVLKTCWRTRPYDLFLKFIRRVDSPHLPAIHRQSSTADGRQWVEMERLDPLTVDGPEWAEVNAFATYCHAIADRRPMPTPTELPEALRVLAEQMGKMARRNDVSLDLSPANIMRRPDSGEIVLVDPFW